MLVDFKTLPVNPAKDRPCLILRNPAGYPLGLLGHATEVAGDFCLNEVSKLTFAYPAWANGLPTPHYHALNGFRIVDLEGQGQFILVNPKREFDGLKAVKRCTAYSLEFELTYKQITLESGTYNLWNPAAPDGTVLGEILRLAPSWSVGDVDSSLVGRYRTFDVSGENIYNWMRSTAQDAYRCLFIFDTYGRRIHVRDADAPAATRPVYIAPHNLIKSVTCEEDTESVVTCLDVNGADGVDIRAVNPMGGNKLYDLGHFMTTDNFDQTVIDKYAAWRSAFSAAQLPYYHLTVERTLKSAEKLTEEARLTDMRGELTGLENVQAATIQAIARGLQPNSALATVNAQLTAKRAEINTQLAKIATIETAHESLTASMQTINANTALSAFFTPAELLLLDRYIKEDALVESTFVAPEARTYAASDESRVLTTGSAAITASSVTRLTTAAGRYIWTADGGRITAGPVTGEVIKASMETFSDNSFLLTAYVKNGQYDGRAFAGGCLSLSGTAGSVTHNLAADPDAPSLLRGTQVSVAVTNTRLYFSEALTEYESMAVAWDLFDFGAKALDKLASPSYTFNVEAANFLAAEEFTAFRNALTMGDKVYVELEDGVVREPVVVRCVVRFDNPREFLIEFSNTYSSRNSEFRIADLLSQSISMGKKLNFDQFTYNAWVDSGAKTRVAEFMRSSLDVSRNAILSSANQAITMDEAGLRLRKWTDGTHTAYEPHQIWMNNNSIMMTDDSWQSAKIAIGRFRDTNAGDGWGIVAPALFGTILAGENLIIESQKKDGGVSVFRVDGEGAALHNATFDLYNGAKTQITLNPVTGIAIGEYPLYNTNNYAIDTTKAKFWADADGNLHLKGALEAATGTFSGVVRATDFQTQSGTSMLDSGKWKPDYLKLTGLNINNKFLIDDQGNVTLNGGTISWNNLTSHDPTIATAQSTADAAYSNANSAANTAYRIAAGTYSGGSFINMREIWSPTIKADTFVVTPETVGASTGGYQIQGYDNSNLREVFKLRYFTGGTSGAPTIHFESSWGAVAHWDFGLTRFNQYAQIEFDGATLDFDGATLDFDGATIRNLDTTARFA